MTENNKIPQSIGRYRPLKLIGKGGMGEIYLVRDPICERSVALKKIRPNLIKYPVIRNRFLREAKIASQLSHPSIIPIHTIHQNKEEIYYTMPYIEGETLKEIIKITKEKENNGETPHPIGVSIPSLMRIFHTICHAVAFAHSKKILHRDLKSENIIVGKFGEVIILDWGLAEKMNHIADEKNLDLPEEEDLTHPGKIVGTINYMAPERALNTPATPSTDIYSLGVLLYQLLTLTSPFERKSLKNFKKQMKREKLIPPQEMAPQRDIPRQLAEITKKSLSFSPKDRYQSINEILTDIERYSEGYPEWIPTTELNNRQKSDWEFQENVLLAKHIALTRTTNVMEWVMLMVSKQAFSGNIRLKTTLTLGPTSKGMGFLIGVPTPTERKSLEEGFCLWIGSARHPGCKLYRNNTEVLDIPKIGLETNKPTQITIERVENHFRLFVDNELKLHYVSHMPLIDGHVGLLHRDGDFILNPLHISLGSQNIMVNCLSIPDAFLLSKDYPKALAEYRRISKSFQGRTEGREALFRAGLTLIEQAKITKEKKPILKQALEEFDKLHNTPGAPLAYLGKSLIYNIENEPDEEAKCFDIALRKYPKHPLFPILQEHLITRLQEASKKDRIATYHFTLLLIRHLPHLQTQEEIQALITTLTTHWESLPFFEPTPDITIPLSFWLAKPAPLYEISQSSSKHLGNILAALTLLDYPNLIQKILKEHPHFTFPITLSDLPKTLTKNHLALLDNALTLKTAPSLLPLFSHFSTQKEDQIILDSLYIWAALLANNKALATSIFSHYPQKTLLRPTTPLFFLYGCSLLPQNPKAAHSHFQKGPIVPYPPTSSLLSHYLQNKINLKTGWIQKAFLWEKIQLYRQISLYFKCLGKEHNSLFFENKAQKAKAKTHISLNF